MGVLEFPVYIPTKGRATTCLTPHLLADDGISFVLVVEPQDYDDYRDAFPDAHIEVLAENDRGIAYARSGAKDFSVAAGDLWHWQFDDDLKSLRRRIDNKNVIAQPRDVMQEMEEYVADYDNIGIAGLRNMVFAFSVAHTPVSFSNQCAGFVLIKNNELRWRYGVIEDTDYSMQVLTSGLCTVLFNRLIFDTPSTFSMQGGLYGYHGSPQRVEFSKGLQQRWPGAFELREDAKGLVRVKPSRVWRGFAQRPGQFELIHG